MAVLERFDTPARLPEPAEADAVAWSRLVGGIFRRHVPKFPQVFDPTVTETPADAASVDIVWTAFPARLLRGATSQEQRWAKADSDRAVQDEYCEWSVERNSAGTITRVTFSTEVPEYWRHIAGRDPKRVLALYRRFVDRRVQMSDLFDNGVYQADNKWNNSTRGRPAHLVQDNNSLSAAVDLLAAATVLRQRDGQPVVAKQELARCAGLGDPFRNSDPQIAVVVNGAAREGDELTLQDPLGLYIDGITTSGLHAPDNANPASFWSIERGDAKHAVRARFEVPARRGYAVGDITSGRRPIRFGAQLADLVRIRLTALVKPASRTPRTRPCGQ